MRVLREKQVEFRGEGSLGDNQRLTVRYDNMGEPYREGAVFSFEDGSKHLSLFLEQRELQDLHTLIGNLLAGKR